MDIRRSLVVASALALLAAAAGAEPPRISSVTPDSLRAGSPGATLTVDGGVFSRSSVVRWNGSPRATHFVSASQLIAQLTQQDLTAPGVGTVDVADGRSEPSNALDVRISAERRSTVPAGSSSEARLASSAPAAPRRIVFDRLPPGTRLVISDLQGRVIAEIPAANGSAVWTPGEGGSPSVRPGVYVYRALRDGSAEVEGVVSVMR